MVNWFNKSSDGNTTKLQDASALIEKENFRSASRIVEAVLKNDPGNQEALYLRALLFAKETRKNKSEKTKSDLLEKAEKITRERKNAGYLIKKANVLAEYDNADNDLNKIQIEALEEALRIEPANSRANDIRLMLSALNKKSPVQIPPEPDFISDIQSGEKPLVVRFTDLSRNYPNRWNWDFGDGSTASVQNPTYTFEKAGEFTITLTVSNNAGSKNKTKSKFIKIKSKVGDPPISYNEVDPDRVYFIYVEKMFSRYPEVMAAIEADQSLRLKGYLYDAFEGATPKEFNILINCIDEGIPHIIYLNRSNTTMRSIKLQNRRRTLTQRAFATNYIDWAIDVWEKTIIQNKSGDETSTENNSETDINLTF